MADLATQLRALHDATPITEGEVRARATRRRRARWGTGGLVAAVAAAGIALVLLTGGGHPQPVVVSPAPSTTSPPVSTPDKAAPVYVTIALDRTTVRRGQPIHVTVDVVNTTGHPVARGWDCNPPLVVVYLTNGKVSNPGGIGEPGCGETNQAGAPIEPTLSPGHHRSTQVLQTVYDACLEPGGTSVDPTYPLPTGLYRTAVELLQLPPGTVAPDPVPITILPDPIGEHSAPAGIPLGWGRLTGRLGPGSGKGGVPDVGLTFTNGKESFATTVIGNVYEIELPTGTWSVHGAGVCATGLLVATGWQRDDLVWPSAAAGCPTGGAVSR